PDLQRVRMSDRPLRSACRRSSKDANGEWRLAPPLTGAAVINTGDLMERWTNDCFKSTVHCVWPIAGSRVRYSIAIFVDPDSDVVVEGLPSCSSLDRPACYPPITAGEHLRRRRSTLLINHASQQRHPQYPCADSDGGRAGAVPQ